MVFLGVAFAFGCLLFGLIVIRSSLKCTIARRYLCQIAAAGTLMVVQCGRGWEGGGIESLTFLKWFYKSFSNTDGSRESNCGISSY